jgi:hypothetical protein
VQSRRAARNARFFPRWGHFVACSTLIVLAGSAWGCKEGSSLSGVTVTVTPDFIADNLDPSTPCQSVSLVKGTVSGSRIFIDVVVTDVNELVSGIALKLTYPNLISKFVKCVDGELLPSGDCYFAEPGVGSGEVFIGRSIQAPDPPVTVIGTQIIVSLEFLVFGEGQGRITIEAQNLGGGDASALLDENGDPILVQWFAGDLLGS